MNSNFPKVVKVVNACLQCGREIDIDERYCAECKNVMKEFPSLRRDSFGRFMPYEVYNVEDNSIVAAAKTIDEIKNDELVKFRIEKGEILVWCNCVTNEGGFLGSVPF